MNKNDNRERQRDRRKQQIDRRENKAREREDVSKRYLHTHKESKTEKYRNKQDKGNERERGE